MTRQKVLLHRDFIWVYGFGILTAIMIAVAWYTMGDRTSDLVGAIIFTTLCAGGPLTAIGTAIAVMLNRSGQISHFTALRTIVKK